MYYRNTVCSRYFSISNQQIFTNVKDVYIYIYIDIDIQDWT